MLEKKYDIWFSYSAVKKKQDLTAHDIEGMFLLGNDFGRQ